ncbi:aminotransferase-like domain-containing protein [Porticoccus sp.]
MSSYQYQKLVTQFAQDITQGSLRPGDRMPSIRQLATAWRVSKTTVITAYNRLEAMGLIESRPKSGFFVRAQQRHRQQPLQAPQQSRPRVKPFSVSSSQVIVDIMEKAASFDLLPDVAQQEGNTELRQCLSRAQRRQGLIEQHYYDEPLGHHALREQIARRVHHGQRAIDADEVVITHGCQHALLLALMAVAQPGDIVAVESPGFYGAIQLLETLNIQVIELPSSPATGIDVEAFGQALRQWDIVALIVAANYATPTGACMPDAAKQALLAICGAHRVTIIEDDVYGELYFGPSKPRSLYSFDTSGAVILCASFSKSLSRDLRIGWLLPGKYSQKVKQLKVVTAIAIGTTTQKGVALYLAQGSYERYLKKRRRELEGQLIQWQNAIKQYFPSAQSCSSPQGGLALWAELPTGVDTIKLYARAQQQGITITPGPLFSAQKRYRNYLRLSFAEPLTAKRENALKCLERLVQESL